MNNIQNLISSLPATRKDVDWKNRVVLKLPSLDNGDAYTEMLSKEDVKEWTKDFISKYKEKPNLVNKGNKVEVTNQKFKDYQSQYINAKSGALKDFGTTNENKTKMKRSEFVNQIKEQVKASLLEKKKTKKDDEEIDVNTDAGEDLPADVAPTNGVDPNIKAIQTALTKAQEAANALGDQKLITQIGNSLTYFTRAHVSKTEVSE